MAILKLRARADILRPNYVGGDSYDYCVENNLFHRIHKKDDIVYCPDDWTKHNFFKDVPIEKMFNGEFGCASSDGIYYSDIECTKKASTWNIHTEEWELIEIL